jgi:glycosyltransferase involved in cell wall biosynthesis
VNVAIITRVFNESVNLPIWLRHYRAQCPDAALFVVDHGSTDGSTRDLQGVHRVPLRRSPFDDSAAVAFMADLQHALLRFYDVVVCTDCDEMLLADPALYPSLAAFLAAVPSPVVAPTGLHLFQADHEPAIDLAAPILGQRRYVWFGAGMCKPAVTRVPVRWQPGYHCCDRLPDYRSDLFQFHLATMDRAISLARLHLTRTMAWADSALRAGHGGHQRISDAEHLHRSYAVPVRALATAGPGAFDFTADLRRLIAGIAHVDGFHVPQYFRGTIACIPERFCGRI